MWYCNKHFWDCINSRTGNPQQAACPSKYWASARQVDPYEITTQCAHSNEKCFRKKKNQEQIVIKLMDTESALTISLCSRCQLYLMDT